MTYVVCETPVAMIWHVRKLRNAPQFSGGIDIGESETLCGARASWDIKFDIDEAIKFGNIGCSICSKLIKEIKNDIHKE